MIGVVTDNKLIKATVVELNALIKENVQAQELKSRYQGEKKEIQINKHPVIISIKKYRDFVTSEFYDND